VLGSLAGISEIVKATFGDGRAAALGADGRGAPPGRRPTGPAAGPDVG
jgi:hypothetical protein